MSGSRRVHVTSYVPNATKTILSFTPNDMNAPRPSIEGDC